jgi:hypothetical protein
MNPKIKQISIYLGLFLLLTGGSYYLFSYLLPVGSKSNTDTSQSSGTPTIPGKKQTGVITFSGPKTEVCPLNGQLYTKEEKDIWQKRRPLAVMIENHSDARPQSGLQSADIVYEAVAEGGITRFMALYYCNILSGTPNRYDVGPVRSARTYFLDIASEYADYPLYTHVGGANCSAPSDPVTGRQSGPCTTNKKALAIEQISDYGWNNKGTWGDLSQFSLSYKVCRREPERTGDERATEHTMYCSTSELWNVAESRGLTNMTLVNNKSWDKSFRPWSFTQKDVKAETVNASTISFDFWGKNDNYSVAWKYDSLANSYSRTNGGKPHIDFNTGTQLTTKNVVIQYSKESRSIDIHMHNLYEMVGSGTGMVFRNGTKEDITWTKANRVSRTIFKDKSGKEINFVPGLVWVEILPINSTVNYEGTEQS